jgi:hypothetical protein
MVGGEVGIASYRETFGRGPGAVAGGADDAGLLDVAGADQAGWDELAIRARCLRGCGLGSAVRCRTSCQRRLWSALVLAPDLGS